MSEEINSYRAYRELERWLYRGAPEEPISAVGGETHNHVSDRRNGFGHPGGGLPPDWRARATKVATITYHHDTGEVDCRREDPILKG